jgi:hypothetical protein
MKEENMHGSEKMRSTTRSAMLIAVIAILFTGGALNAAVADAQSSQAPVVKGGALTSYDPAVFLISFPTNTQPNVTVHSLANGLFTYKVATTSPLSTVSIHLNSSDVYQIILGLTYPIPVSGNITWNLINPMLLPGQSGIAEFGNDTQVLLSWQVSLTQSPQCVNLAFCEEQIANANAAILINYDQQKIALLEGQLYQYQATSAFDEHVTEGIAGAVALVVAVIAVDRLFGGDKRRRIWGNDD